MVLLKRMWSKTFPFSTLSKNYRRVYTPSGFFPHTESPTSVEGIRVRGKYHNGKFSFFCKLFIDGYNKNNHYRDGKLS